MQHKGIIVSIFALMLGAAAFAGEKHRMQVELAVDGDATQAFRFSSDDAGFELHDLQIGESRTIMGESGETAMVTRTEDGFVFNVNGKTIRAGHMATPVQTATLHGNYDVLVDASDDAQVEKAVKVVKIEKIDSGQGITVISGDSLGESTQQQIRDVLISSGHTEDVTFVEVSKAEGDDTQTERVHIITQEVDVTN